MKSKVFQFVTAIWLALFFIAFNGCGETKAQDTTQVVFQAAPAPTAPTAVAPVAPVVYQYQPVAAPAPTTYQLVEVEEKEDLGDFLRKNWLALLLALIGFVEVVVRLTPTETDNSILNIIKRLIDAWFPNVNRGGGSHL